MSEILTEQVAKSINEAIIATINSRMDEIQRIALLQAKDVLNMDEVCMLTGYSKQYLYKQICYKRIPSYKADNGRYTYFKKSEIAEWMLKNRSDTAAEIEEQAALYVAQHPIKKGGRR